MKKVNEWELKKKEVGYALWLFSRNKLVVFGSLIVVFYTILAIFGPFIVNPKISEQVDLSNALKPPTLQHIFGTDDLGRDLLQLIVLGARFDMSISLMVVLTATLIGVTIGSISGYAGGKVDEIIMRFTDILLAFPGLVFAMGITMALGRSAVNLFLALTLVWWTGYARIMRGQVLSEKEKLYVQAAKSLGIPDFLILFKHVFPNAIYPILVLATMDIGGVMLSAAGLSFIGLGPSPFEPEWGQLINRGASYLFIAPWIMFFPGLAVLTASLGFNLIGDGLRDVLDPRLRR
ncbi:MAG: ABC transporter permease [Thermoproteota archaeon]|nr:ABC transporter permease [Candidatus Brockarchaeota archaeon]MBO3768758.1 ABC transporter permease [Candidatus Brockarchaeota archaeon]MBO3800841.1 ABC transporter permease [Candidatus Brockarchaeota archaeon]